MKRPNTCVNLIKAINQIDKSGDPEKRVCACLSIAGSMHGLRRLSLVMVGERHMKMRMQRL